MQSKARICKFPCTSPVMKLQGVFCLRPSNRLSFSAFRRNAETRLHIVPEFFIGKSTVALHWYLVAGYGFRQLFDGHPDGVPRIRVTVVSQAISGGDATCELLVDLSHATEGHFFPPPTARQIDASRNYVAIVRVPTQCFELFRLSLQWRDQCVQECINRRRAGVTYSINNQPEGTTSLQNPVRLRIFEF